MGDGVNVAIPGLWHTLGPGPVQPNPVPNCTWQRTNALTNLTASNSLGVGTSSDTAHGGGPMYAEILPTDVGFVTHGCQDWVQADGPLDQHLASPGGPIGTGEYRVGAEVSPGTYQMQPVAEPPGVDSQCFWERLSAFTGRPGAYDYSAPAPIIASGRPLLGQVATVTIEPGDVGFRSIMCNPWVKISS